MSFSKKGGLSTSCARIRHVVTSRRGGSNRETSPAGAISANACSRRSSNDDVIGCSADSSANQSRRRDSLLRAKTKARGVSLRFATSPPRMLHAPRISGRQMSINCAAESLDESTDAAMSCGKNALSIRERRNKPLLSVVNTFTPHALSRDFYRAEFFVRRS